MKLSMTAFIIHTVYQLYHSELGSYNYNNVLNSKLITNEGDIHRQSVDDMGERMTKLNCGCRPLNAGDLAGHEREQLCHACYPHQRRSHR